MFIKAIENRKQRQNKNQINPYNLQQLNKKQQHQQQSI